MALGSEDQVLLSGSRLKIPATPAVRAALQAELDRLTALDAASTRPAQAPVAAVETAPRIAAPRTALELINRIGEVRQIKLPDGQKVSITVLKARELMAYLGVDSLTSVYQTAGLSMQFDAASMINEFGMLVNQDKPMTQAILDAVVAKAKEQNLTKVDALGMLNLRASRIAYEKLHAENFHNKFGVYWFWTVEKFLGHYDENRYPKAAVVVPSNIDRSPNSRFCRRDVHRDLWGNGAPVDRYGPDGVVFGLSD